MPAHKQHLTLRTPPERPRVRAALLAPAFPARSLFSARRRGFTLLEAALATVIIGVGVLALVDAQMVFSKTNDWSSSSATAAYLANELRERMRSLPRHDPVNGLYFTTNAQGNNVLNGWGPEPGELTAADYDDIDDYDGQSFGAGGTQPGPIDAYARVISAIGPDGQAVVTNGVTQPLAGWTQTVTVEKVDPFNLSTVRAHDYQRAASGSMPALAVNQFPLRVTVVVMYQGPTDTAAREMARVVWIAP